MLTLTKFSAEWCPPCQKMKPVITELQERHQNWKIVEIDIEKKPELADKENIQSVPTLIFSDGKKTERVSGYMSKAAIERFVKKNLGGRQ